MKYNSNLLEGTMVQAIIDLGEHEDRVLTIVKGKYRFKNK